MVKVIDTALKKDETGLFTIKLDVTHDELNILLDALNTRLHKGISDPEERQETTALYSKIFGFWENTSSDPTPIDPLYVKIPDMPCPENAHWDGNVQKCLANAGYYEDKDGVFKPLPVQDCGANAHFDDEKGCMCDDGFQRDKETGLCVPIPEPPPPKEPEP